MSQDQRTYEPGDFHDHDGQQLAIGDPVTVLASSRRWLTINSHGVIEKFGRKLVHVRMTRARLESDDDQVFGFEPDELRNGHHGRPRHPDGWGGQLRDQLAEYRTQSFEQLISTALARGVINSEQALALRALGEDLD